MASGKKNSGSVSFEDSLRRLEEIVEQLERGSISLEESMKMYEEGIALSKTCVDRLMQAELKLKRLGKDMEGNFQLFEEDSG
jgi:exodeoxyribonuclease VII small subunit